MSRASSTVTSGFGGNVDQVVPSDGIDGAALHRTVARVPAVSDPCELAAGKDHDPIARGGATSATCIQGPVSHGSAPYDLALLRYFADGVSLGVPLSC